MTTQHRLVAPTPAPHRSDEFWAQSAVDRSTGALWMCFYDTNGDPTGEEGVLHVHGLTGRRLDLVADRPRGLRLLERDAEGSLYEYGYYQGLVASHGIAHPIWTDTRKLPTLNEEIYTVRLAEAAMPAPAKR